MGLERRLYVDVSRRTFLKASAAAGGGLFIAFNLSEPAAQPNDTNSPDLFAPNAFVGIDREGRVTLVMPQVEMGQGTYTSMSMLIAEELEVGLEQVALLELQATAALPRCGRCGTRSAAQALPLVVSRVGVPANHALPE
jgi:CO/xanthine dehydrogenase Mo-binding subunit